MRTCSNHGPGGLSPGRLLPWLVAAACIAALAILVTSRPGVPADQARPVALAAVAAAASAPVPDVGVQDSWVNKCAKGNKPNFHPQHVDPTVPAVDSTSWRALKMNTVRFSPEWDIADHAPGSHVQVVQDCFDYWLGQLAAHHVQPEIAFKPDTSHSVGGHVRIPTLPVYVAAMKAFLTRYGHQVRIIAPWGEPEFKPKHHPRYELANGVPFDAPSCSKPATDANCGPALAAQMWVAVRNLCSQCTVIAGDFGSYEPKDFQYLATYQRFLRDIHGGHHVYHPTVWAIHPYTDVLRWEHQINNPRLRHTPPQDTLVAHFAARLAKLGYHRSTQIWLDEISSFTKNHRGETYSRCTQAAGARDLLTQLAKAGGASKPGQPVVTRIYYLRFAGKTPDALIVKGHPEPIYHVVVTRHQPHAPACHTAKHTSTARPAKKASTGRPAKRASTARPTERASGVPSPTSTPAIAAKYEIRNTADNLCLDANDLGPTAGRNGDTVQLWTCYGGANQSWIPIPHGSGVVWLANAMYPTKCLNADNIGGLAPGHRVQLWDCYDSPNEQWNVAGLLGNGPNQPLFLEANSQTFALDANKYHLGNGDNVQIWSFYGANNQRWSSVPTQ